MLVCCERWKLEKKAKDENEDYYLPFFRDFVVFFM